jgi:hypothetical protein
MDFMEFAKRWVAENIPVGKLYGDSIRQAILQLAETLAKQHHSGASWDMTLRGLVELNDVYNAEAQRKADELLAANPQAFADMMTELKKHLDA